MRQADGALLAGVCDASARPAAARAGGGHLSRASHVDVGWGGPIDMSLLGPPPADAPPAACDQVRACPLHVGVHVAVVVLRPLELALPLSF